MLTIDQLIESLTLADVDTYNAQADKYVYVQYKYLDPNNLSRRYAERVENALDLIDQQYNA